MSDSDLTRYTITGPASEADPIRTTVGAPYVNCRLCGAAVMLASADAYGEYRDWRWVDLHRDWHAARGEPKP